MNQRRANGGETGDEAHATSARAGRPHTEAAVSAFHDRTHALYRKFWGPSDHWGVFDSFEPDPESFVAACRRADELLLTAAGLAPGDHVLDVGCGHGTTALWLAARTGCQVTGIDLSEVKIGYARAAGAGNAGCDFEIGSATALRFEDAAFDAVWSQAALYQVLDRPRALAEFRRVLRGDGRLVFDDLTTPEGAPLTEESLKWVYERLVFEPTWSMEEYRRQLPTAGFQVRVAEDLTPHLRHSYALLAKRAEGVDPTLPEAYAQMVAAIDRGDLGWARFTADIAGTP
jgi:ubiquinone/menaquinone biosynthesis C-methylase UbiE